MNDIWHLPSEAPAYCFQCVFYDTASNEYHFGQYSPVFKHFRSGNAGWEHEEVQKFAFAKDIITCLDELYRTRKALAEANEKLRHCVNITVEELDELKGNLLIAWNALLHFSKDPIANNALKKITAEQKDE